MNILKKGHDSRAIGNIFVSESLRLEYRLTIMSLVKLVYIAHGWTLGHTGKPLVCHQAEAWRHGPVIPEVYDAFRSQGVAITKKAFKKMPDGKLSEYTAELSDDEEVIVKEVYKAYAEKPAFTLSQMTHREGTPWYQCKGILYGPIPNPVIRKYYKGRIDERRKNS